MPITEFLSLNPTAWILNQALLASNPTDPTLRARAQQEVRHLDEVIKGLKQRVVVLPKCNTT